MSDLISRQAAIDAHERIFDRCEEIEAHLPEGDPDRVGYKMYPDWLTVWKYLNRVRSEETKQQPLTEDDYAYCTECDHVEMCRWYPMYGCEFKSRPSAEPESIEQIKWERDTAIQQLADLGYGLGEKLRKGDCISRQAVLKGISLSCTGQSDVIKAEAALVRYVKKIPSAEPERKTGNWIGIDDEPCEAFECDRCGYVLEDWIQGAFYNFCPNCGADMRGEEDEI